MSIAESLIGEYKHEMAITRKILMLVPMDQADWKPHEKSMKLGRLAHHLAELPTWINYTLNYPELDFAIPRTPVPPPRTSEELIKMMDDNVAKGIAILKECSDDRFQENWTMRNGATLNLTLLKLHVLRSFVLNHRVLPRLQLGVYVR